MLPAEDVTDGDGGVLRSIGGGRADHGPHLAVGHADLGVSPIASRARGAAWRRRASRCRPLRPPRASTCSRVAASRRVLPGPAAPSTTVIFSSLGAVDDLRDQVVLDREYVRRAQRTDMLRSVVAVDQRHARRHRPRCQVLGEFTPYGATGDHVAGGDQPHTATPRHRDTATMWTTSTRPPGAPDIVSQRDAIAVILHVCQHRELWGGRG